MFIFLLCVRDHKCATRSNKKIPSNVWIEASFPPRGFAFEKKIERQNTNPAQTKLYLVRFQKCDEVRRFPQVRELSGDKRNCLRCAADNINIRAGYCAWGYWVAQNKKSSEMLQSNLLWCPIIPSPHPEGSQWHTRLSPTVSQPFLSTSESSFQPLCFPQGSFLGPIAFTWGYSPHLKASEI